jgi:hypothetical protein
VVQVLVLQVTSHLEAWPEKRLRKMAGLSPQDAALPVDKPELITLLGELENSLR